MRDISAEQKLQLTRQVRERYRQDRQDLGQREKLLYGKPLSYFEEDIDYFHKESENSDDTDESQNDAKEKISTVGLRLLLAVVMVCLLALTHRRGDTLLGLTSGQIQEYIRYDCMPKP